LNKRGTPISGTYKAPDGSLVEYKGTVPFGFKFDDATKKIVPNLENGVNPIDTIAATIFDDDQKKGYIKQIVGSGIMFNNNPDDYIKQLVEGSINGNISFTTKKSPAEYSALENKAIRLERENSPEFLAEQDRQVKAKENMAERRTRAAEKSANANLGRLGIATQQENRDKEEFDIKKETGNLGQQNTATGLELNSTDSFYSDTKYKGKDIIGIGNSVEKGLVLQPKYGQPIALDTQPKINDYMNNVDVETRKTVRKIMSSPNYKPVGGQRKAVGQKVPAKFDPNDPI
jgi:hypothetical protein